MGKELTTIEVVKKSKNRIKNIWLDFWLLMLYEIGMKVPFHSARNFFYRISGMKIGKDSYIHMWARFFNPAGVEIGNGSIIGDHAFLDGRARLKIGSNVDIASHVLIYNSEHDVNSEGFDPIEEEVQIGDYAFIGPRVTILPGVKIGKGAVVGAGAVVTKDVKPYTIVAGVPAKPLRKR